MCVDLFSFDHSLPVLNFSSFLLFFLQNRQESCCRHLVPSAFLKLCIQLSTQSKHILREWLLLHRTLFQQSLDSWLYLPSTAAMSVNSSFTSRKKYLVSGIKMKESLNMLQISNALIYSAQKSKICIQKRRKVNFAV